MQRWHPRVFSAVEKTVETGQSVPTLLQKLRELQSTDAKFTQSTLALKKAQERRPGQLEKEVALVMWLAATATPLNAIEHPTFDEMLTAFNVTVRSRTTLLRSVIPALVAHVEGKASEHLKRAHGVAISLDGWDAKGGRKVLGAVAHVLSETLEFTRHVFCVTEIPGRASAPLLAALLDSAILRRIGTNRTIAAIVTDHALNYRNAGEREIRAWWGCMCHFVQLVVEDAMKGS